MLRALALLALVVTGPYAAGATTARQAPTAAAPAAAAGADAGVSERSSKRVGAVVDTLEDLLQSISNEEVDEEKNYKCVKQWCENEISAKKTEIESMQIALEDQKVAVSQHQSRISLTQYQLDKNKKDVTEISNGIEQANSIRDEENQKYAAEADMNGRSIQQISQAIQIVDRVNAAGGFLQNGRVQRMQLNEPGESGFVLGIFRSLKQNLERNAEKAQTAEQKKVAMHSQLVQTKSAELADTQKDSGEKEVLQSQSKTSLTQATTDIQTLTQDLKEWETYLAKTEGDCKDKEHEWRIRSEDRSKEKAAIREAVSFLRITFQEREQVEAQQQALLLQQDDEEAAAKDGGSSFSPPAAFVQFSMSSGSLGQANALVGTADAELAALTAQVNSNSNDDLFGEVKGTIQKLISVIEGQDKAEREKKQFCVKEKKGRLNEQQKTNDALGSLNATIDRKDSEVALLVREANELNQSITESAESDKVAGKLRAEQKTIYDNGTRDRKLAIRVLREATTVLRKFYDSQDSTGLLQKRASGHRQRPSAGPASGEAMPATPTGSSRKSGESNVVLAMLEKITEDVSIEQRDADKDEKEAAEAWRQHQRESREAYDSRMREITLRVTRKAEMLVQLDSHREGRREMLSTLASIDTQLAGLASECNDLVTHFDDRTKARQFEVAQLRDVIDILSGSAVAARTGFIQRPLDGLGDGESLALRDMSRAIDGLEQKARRMVVVQPAPVI